MYSGFVRCSEIYSQKRETMVENQIKSRGIHDPAVLNAMNEVKRREFVPPVYQSYAYSDQPLPIGHGQTISQPYIVALMTSLLELDQDSKVLEIGTGSGYQAAILAELCDSVFSVEIIEELGTEARQRLHKLGYDNVFVRIGDGYQGWQEHAPYDGIIVTCAPPEIPEALKAQLKNGGRMVVPVGEKYQDLQLLIKKDGKIKEKSIIPVRFVPMLHENEIKE
ncbi:MAG TPA: protein-L-isoaspartate(D-aspartate) O-methyltransferase [bacterium]|nr:protein-L-isoaspartate(D-aspartate) O-methyltransferase [bacterium]